MLQHLAVHAVEVPGKRAGQHEQHEQQRQHECLFRFGGNASQTHRETPHKLRGGSGEAVAAGGRGQSGGAWRGLGVVDELLRAAAASARSRSAPH